MMTIKKEDTVVQYGFVMCIENDTDEIENIEELEEIIIGATDEIIDNFNQLSHLKRYACALRINALLKTFNDGRR